MSDRVTRSIGRRLIKWALVYPDVLSNTIGYCMSGQWHDYYCTYFFPQKDLNLPRLQLLIDYLALRGYGATLHIRGEAVWGLYLYMHLSVLD